jgi:hypothetical protein
MITTKQFETFKTAALENEPVRKKINLSELKFITSSIVEVQGVNLFLSDEALSDLYRILGLSRRINKKMNTLFGEELAFTIMNMLKAAISSKNSQNITLVINENRKILRVIDTPMAMASYDNFFHITERLINRNNLELSNLSVNDKGEIVINTKHPDGEFSIKGFSDEVFKPGLSFSNAYTGIHVDPFMYRLVCTNGMITRLFQESVHLQDINHKSFERFYSQVEELERNNFMPQLFAEKMKEAASTPASISEVEKVRKIMEENADIKPEHIEKFIPFLQTVRDYHRLGINVNDLSAVKKRNARTGLSVWMLINGLTDFASHDYGYKFLSGGPQQLQIFAGNMLCKNYDIANLVEVSPY